MKRAKNLGKLLLCVLTAETAGALGTIFTTPNISTWYATLNKPFFSPPNFVFFPVWTTLYFLMGVSLYRVWGLTKGLKRTNALTNFWLQLSFNVLWSFLFFGLHSPVLGLAGIVVLWGLILKMILSFYKIDKTAALLQIPYLLWVSFASALNFSVFVLNF